MRENEIAEFEAEQNEASDLYFNARAKMIDTIHNRKVFESGFRMAWDIKTKKSEFGADHCNLHGGYGFTSDCVVCQSCPG